MSLLVDRMDILEWSDAATAGYDLPRLVRSLISHDNKAITRLYMPAGEGARLSGYDGEVEAHESSVLVPAGYSVWELGVEARPATKATKDYRKRTANPGVVARAETTYIAVTSRSWPKRSEWAAARRAEGVWKDVKAYDVDDLSAALDRDAPSTILFRDLADHRGLPVTTLGHWWMGYRSGFAIPLKPEFVLSGRASQKSQLESWLAGDEPWIDVRAKSDEDGWAFVAAALDAASDQASELILCNDARTARDLLARSRQPLLLVTTVDLADLTPLGVHRAIRINTSGPSTVVLTRQSAHELAELLKAEDVAHDDADRYASAARRSLYRYRLVCSQAPHPLWETEFRDRRFRRLWLLGGWERNHADLESLLRSELGMGLDEATDCVSRDVNSADPVFSHVGDVWRVTAPIESARYFAERADLVPGDLAAFRPVALSVLGEIDPALELPEGERWLADVRGKRHRYGRRARECVATTLAALATECGAEALSRGVTIQGWTDHLVRELLDGWDDAPSMWASLDDVLTLLVEAAPDVILERIRQDLLGGHENVRVLSKTRESPLAWGDSSHLTTILWSLQSLMWSPEHCERALDTARDLAQGIDEGPGSPSALGIVRDALLPQIPQCSLSTSGRVAAVDRCVRDAPEVAKRIIEKTITGTHGFVTVHQTHFRRWIDNKQKVTWADAFDVYEAMIRGAINLAGQYPSLWVTLVEAADNVGARGFDQIVAALKALPLQHASGTPVWQATQATLRRHRRFRDADWALADSYLERLESAVRHLRPALARHREEWLFGGNRFDLGLAADAVRGKDSLLLRMQTEAIGQILAEEGLGGLVELAMAHPTGGWAIGAVLARRSHEREFIVESEFLGSEDPGVKNLARGYFVNAAAVGAIDVLQMAESSHEDPAIRARLLLTHPDPAEAWERAELLGEEVANAFWAEFEINGRGSGFAHGETVTRKLLDHGRVGAALDVMGLYGESVSADNRSALILEGLLLLLSQPSPEMASLPSYLDIPELIAAVRKDPSVDRAVVCQLEWAFFPLVEFEEDEPLAIEVAASRLAEDFVHLVDLAYRPRSGAQSDHAVDKRHAEIAFRVLHRMRYTPGLDGEEIDAEALAAWVEEVVRLASASDRRDVALHAVGEIFGRVPAQDGQPYPDPAILSALETTMGDEMLQGFGTAIFNGRGVVWRGHGGQQEYDLAEKYEAISRALREAAPRTSDAFDRLARTYRVDGAREDEREQRIEDGIDRW